MFTTLLVFLGGFAIVNANIKSIGPLTDENNSLFDLDIEVIANDARQEYERIIDFTDDDTIILNNERFDLNDPDVRKWIIRNFIDSKLVTGELVVGTELVEDAVNSLKYRTSLFEYVKDEYDVSVSQGEVEKYIDEMVSLIEESEEDNAFFVKLSGALGLTKKEFFYEWEFDNFAQQLIGSQVYPLLETKVSKRENERSEDYRIRLFEKFNNDLKIYINSNTD